MDPTEWNRNDGFSPGSPILVHVPGLDPKATRIVPVTDIGRSLDRRAPVVLVDLVTGRRWPYWAELDSKARTDGGRLLIIHPAVNLVEGHRYVVALRNMVDTGGRVLRAPRAFARYLVSGARDHRAAAMARILATARRAGVTHRGLYLAWDFTVASTRNLSERLLHMRDETFRLLGTKAPRFHVTGVESPPSGPVLRQITGTVDVPNFLTGKGGPGSVLTNGSGPHDPLPAPHGIRPANFICVIPRSAMGPDGMARPSGMGLYGHGLLGSASEVSAAAPVFSAESNTTFCATDWIGMSAVDIPVAVGILRDLGRFRTLPDRLQQSIVDFLVLGRALRTADGFSSHRAFRDGHGRPFIDRRKLVFVGNSQGGIIGGAASAVATDWTRVFLGVPGMTYATLLDRSVDFDAYAAILDPAYPSRIGQLLGLSLVQMLWDRGENAGYAAHLSKDPYPGTPPKTVLLFEAFGDHQVANVTTEVMARTIGAHLRPPALTGGRSKDRDPFWAIPRFRRLPATGSALVVWDFGTPAPPATNEAPRAGEDPHGAGAGEVRVRRMVAAFLSTDGKLEDVCAGRPCATPAS